MGPAKAANGTVSFGFDSGYRASRINNRMGSTFAKQSCM